jgi:hypothetical protein
MVNHSITIYNYYNIKYNDVTDINYRHKMWDQWKLYTYCIQYITVYLSKK